MSGGSMTTAFLNTAQPGNLNLFRPISDTKACAIEAFAV